MKLSIFIEYSICCDNCGYRAATDLKQAKRIFKKNGWVTITKGTFCPDCANKNLDKSN